MAIASTTGTATASSTSTPGSLRGGAITFGDFTPVTLNGTQRTSAATWAIGDVTDDRGAGAGWRLSLILSPLKQWDPGLKGGAGGYVAGGTRFLPWSSVRVRSAPAVLHVGGAGGPAIPARAVGAVAAHTALDTGSAVTLVSAAGGSRGAHTVGNLEVSLTIPASAYAGTYRADATVSLVTSP